MASPKAPQVNIDLHKQTLLKLGQFSMFDQEHAEQPNPRPGTTPKQWILIVAISCLCFPKLRQPLLQSAPVFLRFLR